MGYNSGIIILHDALHEIKTHPQQFVDGLVQKIGERSISNGFGNLDVRVGCHINAASVFHTAHADVHDVYAIGGNTALRLLRSGSIMVPTSISNKELEISVLMKMADKMGFRLVAKTGVNSPR